MRFGGEDFLVFLGLEQEDELRYSARDVHFYCHTAGLRGRLFKARDGNSLPNSKQIGAPGL
jgi:hypothetical protein